MRKVKIVCFFSSNFESVVIGFGRMSEKEFVLHLYIFQTMQIYFKFNEKKTNADKKVYSENFVVAPI